VRVATEWTDGSGVPVKLASRLSAKREGDKHRNQNTIRRSSLSECAYLSVRVCEWVRARPPSFIITLSRLSPRPAAALALFSLSLNYPL